LKQNFLAFSALVLGVAPLAHAQGQAAAKIGIIHVQNAILSTKDGQKAANELQAKFAPKKAELDKKQNEIAALQDQLRKGSATMSDDAKNKIMRDIDSNTKALNRETEDAQADLDQEQGKLMQELGQKLMGILDKYAKDNGFSVVLDVSNPQTPVLWASNTIDITNDIVSLYDKANPPGAASAPAARPVAPAAPGTPRPAAPVAPAAPRPAAPAAPPKKQ
jgi:outer membrane protein